MQDVLAVYIDEMDPVMVLGIDRGKVGDQSSVKKAYQKCLLAAHPDKGDSYPFTIDQIKEAYKTLINDSRTTNSYAVVDLDDFTYSEQSYYYPCRCGHGYTVRESDLEQGKDVISCDGCSLLVKVTYDVVDDA